MAIGQIARIAYLSAFILQWECEGKRFPFFSKHSNPYSMDFQKSKALLDKINALYRNISGDPRNISNIEKDLMRSYVLQFYECFLQLDSQATPIAAPPPPPLAESKQVEPKITLRRPETAPPPPPPPKPEPPKVERQPEPAPAPPPPPPIVEKPVVVEIPPPPPPPVVKETPVPPPPPPPVYQAAPIDDPDLEELFAFKTATELSEKLSQLPIGDIKKAMGLNERISTQAELFGNDANVFETALSTLNQLRSFDEAKDYLVKNVANRFNWASKAKKDKAKEFIKLVKRRY